MSFSPFIITESKTTPGVTFKTHRMGIAKRSAIDFDTLDLRQKLRTLEMDYPPQTREEKTLAEYLEVAKQKAFAVPAEEFDRVWEEEVTPLIAQLQNAAPAETRKARALLDMEFGAVNARLRVRWVLNGLASLAGGEVDGMSPEELVEFGPPALALEIYDALIADAQTGGAAAKNLKSPGTSGGVGAGATPNTTADTAAPSNSTKSETASSTSPAA